HCAFMAIIDERHTHGVRFCCSSRRRHTRSKRDWSSDVCSSDLGRHLIIVEDILDSGVTLSFLMKVLKARGAASIRLCTLLSKPEIGRASCREREWRAVGAVA